MKRGYANIWVSAGVIAVLLSSQSLSLAGGNPKKGKDIFEGICTSCHGVDGITDIPGIPVFAKGERMIKTDDQLKASIKNGIDDQNNPAGMSMPPYGGGPALDASQLSDVIAYIRTLKK